MKDDDEEEDGLEQEELVVEDVLEQEEDLRKEELLKEDVLTAKVGVKGGLYFSESKWFRSLLTIAVSSCRFMKSLWRWGS